MSQIIDEDDDAHVNTKKHHQANAKGWSNSFKKIF